jgi:hypothetical protein
VVIIKILRQGATIDEEHDPALMEELPVDDLYEN